MGTGVMGSSYKIGVNYNPIVWIPFNIHWQPKRLDPAPYVLFSLIRNTYFNASHLNTCGTTGSIWYEFSMIIANFVQPIFEHDQNTPG